MPRIFPVCVSFAFAALVAGGALAGPKLDKETCEQLKAEQQKFVESGILAEIERGAAYAKDRLSAERIREIEIYITLDEQLKFGCRQATLTGDAIRAGEAARRLELNPDLDPTAPPPPASPQNPAAGGANGSAGAPAAANKPAPEAAAKPAETPKPKPTPKPAAAAKPKVDDTYSPPPGNDTLEGPANDEAGAPAGGRTDVP